jgi:L-iditol 2-dehydrogenase
MRPARVAELVAPRESRLRQGVIADPAPGEVQVRVTAVGICGSDMHIQVARAGGRVVFTGIPSEMETPIGFHAWRRKELALFQVRRSNHEGEPARDLLAAQPARFTPMITHNRPLDHIGAAFAQVERYEDSVGKLVIRLDA